jgi:hypothetical protein
MMSGDVEDRSDGGVEDRYSSAMKGEADGSGSGEIIGVDPSDDSDELEMLRVRTWVSGKTGKSWDVELFVTTLGDDVVMAGKIAPSSATWSDGRHLFIAPCAFVCIVGWSWLANSTGTMSPYWSKA